MALIRPSQVTFGSGEVSPSIYARVDIARYRASLRKCRNFIIQPDGGASNRPGTRFVAEVKDSTKETIVQEFIFNEDQTYIFEFGHEYIRFYTNGARVSVTASEIDEWDGGTTYNIGDYVTLAPSTVYYLDGAETSLNENPASYPATWTATSVYEEPSPYQEEDLQELRFESSADVVYITHPDYQPRTLTRFGATDFRLELFDPEDGPFARDNHVQGQGTVTANVTPSATSGAVSLTASAAIFATTDVGALFKTSHTIESQKVSQNLSSASSTSSIKAYTTWRLVTNGTWTGVIDIEKSSDGGSSWSTIRSFRSEDNFNVDTSGTEDPEVHIEPFLVRVTCSSYTSGTINVLLTSDGFVQDGISEITTYNSAASVWVNTITDIGSTSATPDWAHGAWSGTRGYPGVSRFYQDRLCFAGSLAEPQTIWMSRTGFYDSFLRHLELLDTDGITINLPSRQVNKINGLIGLTRLVVLTTASTWSIGSSSTGIMTPTTIDTRIENYRGSSGVNPVIVGNEVMFIQTNGKTVRNLGFELASESFTGSELNILAKHLFDKWTITDMAYQEEPESVIWALRSDGVLLGCTYLQSQEVIAWHWHNTGAD